MKTDSDKTDTFLLQEYERIMKLSLDEIGQSEHRVDFFLTIASAIAGFTIVVSQAPNVPNEIKNTAIQGILVVLLFFGMITLNRLNARGAQTRVYQILQNKILSHFAQNSPTLKDYAETLNKAYKEQRRSGIITSILKRLRGTLTDLIVFSNACICSGITIISLSKYNYSIETISSWAVATFIGSLILFYGYHNFMSKKLDPF